MGTSTPSQPAPLPGKTLEPHGIRKPGPVHWNLSSEALYEHALRQEEGIVSESKAFVVETGAYTGRSPRDKYVVREPTCENDVWWGLHNQPFPADRYPPLRERIRKYMEGKELFVQDCRAGHSDHFELQIRVISEKAWSSLFARNLFVPDAGEAPFTPGFTILHVPGFHAESGRDGTRSEVCILLNFAEREILIGGTRYAGEIKKSVFTVLNHLLPAEGMLPMHCSANKGKGGDVALFFGLSGTGKTSLSADPERLLIGDDEHGWSDKGVFNFEGGCYAKVIRLSAEAEPQIWQATHRFGTILENVAIDPGTGTIDLDDASKTENTRAAYPLDFINNHAPDRQGSHPRHVIFLTCDAFGVMPPLARLDPDQAMYHFLSGYTAQVAGTERGVDEPKAVFSTCFGAPFMARPPAVYADLLGRKLAGHRTSCWLVNTGWTGGPVGTGHRIPIPHTRAMISAILSGRLEDAPTRKDRFFGLQAITACPDVPEEIFDPRGTWPDPVAYDAKAKDLVARFEKNFEAYADSVSPEIRAAGPAISGT